MLVLTSPPTSSCLTSILQIRERRSHRGLTNDADMGNVCAGTQQTPLKQSRGKVIFMKSIVMSCPGSIVTFRGESKLLL